MSKKWIYNTPGSPWNISRNVPRGTSDTESVCYGEEYSFSVSKDFSTHCVPLGTEHLGCETKNDRTETSWTLSVSPLVHVIRA